MVRHKEWRLAVSCQPHPHLSSADRPLVCASLSNSLALHAEGPQITNACLVHEPLEEQPQLLRCLQVAIDFDVAIALVANPRWQRVRRAVEPVEQNLGAGRAFEMPDNGGGHSIVGIGPRDLALVALLAAVAPDEARHGVFSAGAEVTLIDSETA